MKYNEVESFIKKNNLLKDIPNKSGIYAITIDGYVVYIGKSKDMYQRCSQHIYNTENAILNKEQKYLLLLSAKLGGHTVDCVPVEFCKEEYLNESEDFWMYMLDPCLNIITPEGKRDISNLKIKDVLNNLKHDFSNRAEILRQQEGEK